MRATMYGLKLRMLHDGCLCDVWCCVYYSNIDNNIIPNCWYILATKERLRKKIISAAKTKLDETTPKDVVFATAVCCGLSSLPGMDINWIKLMLKLFMKFATSLYCSISFFKQGLVLRSHNFLLINQWFECEWMEWPHSHCRLNYLTEF